MKTLADFQPYQQLYVDAMNLCSRSHYGMPMLSHNGRRTGMLFGVARLVLDWQCRHKGVRIVFIWEGDNSWRKAEYPIYKSNRKPRTAEEDSIIDDSVSRVREALKVMGVHQVWADTYEADDTVWRASAVPGKKLFVSTDWDWWTLYHRGDILYENHIMTHLDLQAKFAKKYKCDPIDMDRLWLFKVLTGDSSDGIPGVWRFPKKLAANLCNSNTTLAGAERMLREMGKLKWADKVRDSHLELYRNDRLVKPSVPSVDKLIEVPGEYSKERFGDVLLKNGMSDLYDQLERGR